MRAARGPETPSCSMPPAPSPNRPHQLPPQHAPPTWHHPLPHKFLKLRSPVDSPGKLNTPEPCAAPPLCPDPQLPPLLTSAGQGRSDCKHLVRVGGVSRVVLQQHKTLRAVQGAAEVGFPAGTERALSSGWGVSCTSAGWPPATGHGPGLGKETEGVGRGARAQPTLPPRAGWGPTLKMRESASPRSLRAKCFQGTRKSVRAWSSHRSPS